MAYAMQCLPHMPRVELTLGVEESTAKVGQMCTKKDFNILVHRTRTLSRTFYKNAYNKRNAQAYAQGLEWVLFKDKANAQGQEHLMFLRNSPCACHKAITVVVLIVEVLIVCRAPA